MHTNSERHAMNKVRGKIGVGLGVVFFAVLIAIGGTRSQAPTPQNSVDEIVILKSARTMSLESGGRVLKTYKVALGRQPVGAKDREGDHKTPEGEYTVDAKNPQSDYHLALHLSYPNDADRDHARSHGVSPGSDIEIHGLPKEYGWIGAGHRLMDWTDGCIAVTNAQIEEIFGMVPVGTRVEIKP
jgi:murein L,D-transpeptidase YafK